MYIKPQMNLEVELFKAALKGKAPTVVKLKPSRRRGVKLDRVSSNSLGEQPSRSLANRGRMEGWLK